LGSYAQCWLDDLFVGSSKNDIDTEIISLFRSTDKNIKTSLTSHCPKWMKHYQESFEEEPDSKLVYYEAPVSVIRDRLDVLGYDLETVKTSFNLWIKEKKERVQSYSEEENEGSSETSSLMSEHYRKELKILSVLTPELWIESLKQIHASGLETNYYGRYEGPHEDTPIGYMLSNDWYGFPGYDFFIPLRLAIEAFEGSKTLVYDITDLVWGGYFEEDDDFVEYGLDISASEYSSKSKIIILTEGKTDAWILSETLEILYPHLRDYYSFLDFDSTGYGGGVGNLSNVVKAFAGAGIVNNVIALFDNDTATQSACKSLEKANLPSNIAIVKLPELELLRSYPTIGPSGSVNLDINGMAASIELYFGEDILKLDGMNLVPIQWTGYDKSQKQYQGEVLEKALLQEKFKEKLKTASPDISSAP
jgi:hypothetical protein